MLSGRLRTEPEPVAGGRTEREPERTGTGMYFCEPELDLFLDPLICLEGITAIFLK